MGQKGISDIKGKWPTCSGISTIPYSEIWTTRLWFAVAELPRLIMSTCVPVIVRELLWLRLTDTKATKRDVQFLKIRAGSNISGRGSMPGFSGLHFGN